MEQDQEREIEYERVDPITSEQNSKKDKRPFGEVHAYLFAASLRGIMTATEETKTPSNVNWNKVKEQVIQIQKQRGPVKTIQCQFMINRRLKDQYNMDQTDSEESE
jgi:hypothetical protein